MSVKSIIVIVHVFSESKSDLVDQTNRIYMLGPVQKIKDWKRIHSRPAKVAGQNQKDSKRMQGNIFQTQPIL